MTLYPLTNYNNYYNRMVKMEEYLSLYLAYNRGGAITNINFNPNDGVTTEIVLGGPYEYLPQDDYLLVCDDNQIVSRWFIIEARRLRNKQYNLTLKRDVIADYKEIIITSPAFIEKATLDSGSPFIFNRENMTVNQIKQRQVDLYDESGQSWIVMYLANNVEKKTYEFTTNVDDSLIPDRSLVPSSGVYGIETASLNCTLNVSGSSNTLTSVKFNNDGTVDGGAIYSGSGIYSIIPSNQYQAVAHQVKIYDFRNYYDNQRVSNAIQYNGITVKRTSDSTYWKVKVEQRKVTETKTFSWNEGLGQNIINNAIITRASNNGITLKITRLEQVVSYEQVSTTQSLSVTLTDGMQKCTDAPYYVLYTPFESNNMFIMQAFATALGAFCYDIQILPYCPELRCRKASSLRPRTANNTLIYALRGQTQIMPIYISAYSSFELTIDYNEDMPTLANDIKVANECDFVRLNSPNGSGSFEFIPVKNSGIHGFHVECSYKPVQPYINICPNFSGLYGSDFKDYRGLICQGDFSMPLVSDAWVQYEQNNKNYQNIFDRQIENMNVNNKAERINQIAGGIAGVFQGTASGAMAGGVAGAVVGGVLSTAGGVADYAVGEMLRNEAIDYTKDLFGYNLGNIKARPQTLSKTGSITIDNHYVPYLEYYSCTDEEKQAVRDKIKYNGMSLGVIGKIIDYLQEDYSYIKGQMIRIEGIEEDFHLLNDIASEINKGVYIK